MHLILLSRCYPLPTGAVARVALLQDCDTLRTCWEVAVTLTSPRTKRVTVGSITRRTTRTEAMRLVRKMLYPA